VVPEGKKLVAKEICAELKFSIFSPVKIFHFALHINEDLVFTKKKEIEKGKWYEVIELLKIYLLIFFNNNTKNLYIPWY